MRICFNVHHDKFNLITKLPCLAAYYTQEVLRGAKHVLLRVWQHTPILGMYGACTLLFSTVLGELFTISSSVPHFTPMVVMLIFFVPFMRVNVLPLTRFILYPRRRPFPYGTCIGLVPLPLVAGYTMRPFLVSKSLIIGTSKTKE